MTTGKMSIAVIGAGPAGITCAYCLSKAYAEVHLYEASASVGGLAKSLDLWGQRVDLGPHRFFSQDRRVNKLWLEVAGTDYKMVQRLTRIYYKKKFYFYPVRIFDVLTKLGLLTSVQCVLSYLKEKIFATRSMGSFESWIVNRFGKKLYTIFFKTYTEKLWGIKCSDLDADFAAQRIKNFSLGEAIKNALGIARVRHKTLVDQFAYPTGGSGMIYERMEEFIILSQNKVFKNRPVRRVLKRGNSVTGIELYDGEVRHYDHVVSTMPLTVMVQQLPEVPAHIVALSNKLAFRNTILVYLHIDGKDLFPDNWLYVHSQDLQMGRISNFRNYVPEINRGKNTTIVALEYWCYDEDSLWTTDDDALIELAKRELLQTGLNKHKPVLDGYVHKIRRCYPVYGRGYKDILKPIEKYLDTIDGLKVIGRYGAFKYNNQDHSILMGILAADSLLHNTPHNLWEINTDYDNYQERSSITASGLSSETITSS